MKFEVTLINGSSKEVEGDYFFVSGHVLYVANEGDENGGHVAAFAPGIWEGIQKIES